MSVAKNPAAGRSREVAGTDSPRVLPLPELVIRHHGQTFHGPMGGWLSQGRLPPVLLLTGLPGVGKRSMGYFLAQWIFCEKVGLNGPIEPSGPPLMDRFQPCDECQSCRKALHGSWIDFTEITSEGGSSDDEAASGASLKIDQFRQLKATLGFGAHGGNYRIVLIPNAERMTVQAANSVLKFLEEPPPGWIFLLTASDPTLLPPTMLSRCQAIRLRPFSPETLLELLSLEDVDPKRREISALLAQGSWGKAWSWTEEEVWKRRKTVLEFLQEPVTALGALVDWASESPRNMDRLIDQLESLTADLIQWSLQPSFQAVESHRWLNSDAGPALLARARQALRAPDRARTFWIARALQLAEARQKLLAPVNRKLFSQALLIPWLDSE